MTETIEDRKQFNLNRAAQACAVVVAGGLVMHASACAKNARAYVFFGPSGAGKSSAMDHSPDAIVLSEEAVALECINGVWHARGLPYAGDARFEKKSDVSYPVAGIYRLHHATANRRLPMSKAAAAQALLTVPAGDFVELMPRVFAAAAKIAEDVVCFELHLRNDESFWEVL